MAAMLRLRYGKERVKVVVSRYDPHAEIGQEDIERVAGAKIRHVLPSDYRAALQALNTGRPLVLSNHTGLAGSYRKLAADLAGLDNKPEPAHRGGLLARLTGRS